jgi:hypothetical protein
MTQFLMLTRMRVRGTTAGSSAVGFVFAFIRVHSRFVFVLFVPFCGYSCFLCEAIPVFAVLA